MDNLRWSVIGVKLRGIPYNPRLAKHSRNITQPPDGWEMEYL